VPESFTFSGTMEITVTQEDIDASLRKLAKPGTFLDKFEDPITRAIRAEFGSETFKVRVMTHPNHAEINGEWYEMSDNVRKWYSKWSVGEEVSPFTFTLTRVPAKTDQS